MVGRVARRVDGTQGHVAYVQIIAWIQLVGVGAHLGGELAAAGDVVVVQVRVQRVRDLDVEIVRELQIALDVAQRVDYEAHAAIGVGDEKACVAQLAGRDCFDRVHVS